MSDSFADLWASSAPTKSFSRQPQKQLGSSPPPRRQQYDAFSILSASQPQSRPVESNQLSGQQGRQPKPVLPGGDAFSGLFTPSLDGAAGGRSPDRANMTMAERAVLVNKAKAAQSNVTSTQTNQPLSSPSLWEGLDTLVQPAAASPRPVASTLGNTSAQDGFDLAFDNAAARSIPQPTSPYNDTSIENNDWGLSKFSSRPSESRSSLAPTKPASRSQPTNLWDLEEFGSSEPRISQSRQQAPARSRTGTPGDFDFGDREDGLLGRDDSDVEDAFGAQDRDSEPPDGDILGDLGKPVSNSHTPSPNPSASIQGSVRPSRSSASPPPHITGQLVEMGFSPIDARAALANTMTENGFDVQAAAEQLLSKTSQEGSARPSSNPPEREQRRNGDRDRVRDRRPPPSHADSYAQPLKSSQTQIQSQTQLDITAEKLLSQAGEIGRGMFSKANALWKEGREKAVKMYEERAGAANGITASDGRPRWMRDADHTDGERERPDRVDEVGEIQAGFKDDEEEETENSERRRPPTRPPPQSQSELSSSRPTRVQEVDLFSADSSTTAYQSPFRRGRPKPHASSPSIQSSSPAPAASPQLPTSALSGPLTSQQQPQPPRTFTTTIAASALVASTSHKSSGTDAYKRGDFPIALAAYQRALSALPSEHVLRVPILTNVGLVRSKVGELKEAIKACEEAIMIVRRFAGNTHGGGKDRGAEMSFAESEFDEKTPVEVGTGKVAVSVQGASGALSNGDLPTSVDLAEGLSKAFKRRAEALEGLERWEQAQSTWEVLLGAEWAGGGVKGEAVKGIGRCRRMTDGGGTGLGSSSAPPKPKYKTNFAPRPRPKPAPRSSASPPPSAALTALRSTHNAQQTEDAARLACKDTVDARITAWKSGREGNIRALLTSLDETILWPELGWRKVGMAEVVSKGQVKGAYVRAIAKVHPDKLNTGNTTVEQRMVANSVFGTLNEAWNAFQQQQS